MQKMQETKTQVEPILTARRTNKNFLSVLVGVALLAGTWLSTSLPAPDRYSAAKSATLLVETDTGYGSGVIIKRENLSGNTRVFLWTAAHVVDSDPAHVQAKLIFREDGAKRGSATFDAKLLAISFESDLALYWVNVPSGMLESAEFDSANSPVPIGTPIFHVGNFLGPNFDNSVSVGIVSQVNLSPTLQGWFWKTTDQADLTVLPGGSGGGVFRADSGKVIGIMVAGVGSGLAAFVPNRTILEFAESAGVDWAVRGGFCPSDKLLEIRAALEAASLPPTLEELFTLP